MESTIQDQKNSSTGLLASFLSFAADIKLAHSIFALPFAASAVFLVDSAHVITFKLGLVLVLCMVTARSFAMGMNRYLDRKIDKKNPRTQSRMIPSGQLLSTQALFWSLFSGLSFVWLAFQLNQMSGWLSIPLLLILAGYSLMKRVSWMTHWYLGVCLGLAPVAVSVALTGGIAPSVILLGLAVSFWTAGFDILYSIQDRKFDQQEKLHSYPARFGAWNSVLVSRVCFAIMVILLLSIGQVVALGVWFYLGVSLMASVLIYEQWLVRDVKELGYSNRIDIAFFNMNAWVSIGFFVFLLLDYYL